MKKLRSMVLAFVLLTLGAAVRANTKPGNERLTQTHAVNTYIAAMTAGKLDGIAEVLDQNVQFNLLRGTKLCSFNKAQILNDFKANENVEQNCTISTSVAEENSEVTVIKVDFKYADFVRTNYVSMVNTGDGWKITNVYSVFK